MGYFNKSSNIDVSLSAVSRQDQLNHALLLHSNNLANSATAGHKRQFMRTSHSHKLFGTVIKKLKDDTDFAKGAFIPTGDPVHIMSKDDSMFSFETDRGTIYSYDGVLSKDVNGTLINSVGNKILDTNGSTITLPRTASSVIIRSDGSVMINGTTIVAKIGTFKFDNPHKLKQIGASAFITNGETPVSTTPSILSGGYEGSNSSSISELVEIQQISTLFKRIATQSKILYGISEQSKDRLLRIFS